VAGNSLWTLTEAEGPPLTVRVKAPLVTPVPVRGMMSGEVASELVMVRVPGRAPRVVGLKVTVAAQLAPGASVSRCRGR
jgi:hypothetical protein